MKSTVTYKTLRDVVAPWTKTAGFKRAGGGMLSYVRAAPGEAGFHTFWFQCSQDGWDAFAGSKFTLEFQEASEPEPGRAGRQSRFTPLLTADEREQVRFLQNIVIKKLRRPPHDHWAHTLDGETKRWYFAKFDLIHDPFGAADDIWMRYGDEADVRRWAEFLVPLLPRMLEDFVATTDPPQDRRLTRKCSGRPPASLRSGGRSPLISSTLGSEAAQSFLAPTSQTAGGRGKGACRAEVRSQGCHAGPPIPAWQRTKA